MFGHFTKYLKANTSDLKYLRTIIKKQQLCTKSITYKKNTNLEIQCCRSLHLNNIINAKVFTDGENAYAYKILQSIPITTNLPDIKMETDKVISNESEFTTFLNQNWKTAKASSITKAFVKVTKYCQEHNINITDNRFDKLVDGLMDNMEKLTTDDLYVLLECLIELPDVESYASHNFHDMWSALDDMCCWKLKVWDLETSFKFAELWRNLNLGRIADYILEFINKISRRPVRLSQQHLVHAFFYMNVCRKRHIEFEWEDAIERKLESLTVDELAIIAMGFFKTQTKVKLTSILNKMIELVTKNSDNIHEISLTAILKILRMSQNPHTADNIVKMLDKIHPEIPRFSHLCATHIALMGTNLGILHEPTLEAVAQKTVENISNIKLVRLKDIERVLLATTMFDYDPKTTPEFYKTLLQELEKDERRPEKVQYPKCLPSALVYLAPKMIYSEQLMSEVLDPEFAVEVYGRNRNQLPRELYFLDLCREIDFPEYKGKKWTPAMRQKVAKWSQDYLPSRLKTKWSNSEKLFFSVIDTISTITGNSKYLYVGHVLPQYAKPDIILCVDRVTNEFVEPTSIQNYPLGQIMYPVDRERYKWYAILVIAINLTTRYTAQPITNVIMKKRHLEAIGYEPILVKWNEYNKLRDEEKIDYILNKMKHM